MMQRSESFAEDPEDEDAIIDERQPVLVKQAPRFTVPSAALDVIEHPCIVKNIDRGLQSLGGSYRIGSVRIRPSALRARLIGPSFCAIRILKKP